jgi:hypothetical protein
MVAILEIDPIIPNKEQHVDYIMATHYYDGMTRYRIRNMFTDVVGWYDGSSSGHYKDTAENDWHVLEDLYQRELKRLSRLDKLSKLLD